MAVQLRAMTEIPLNQACEVVRVEGALSLRLLDLGFYEGSQIYPLYVCPGGGTRLYEVKDTRIALRDRDAAEILVKAVNEHDSGKKMLHRFGR